VSTSIPIGAPLGTRVTERLVLRPPEVGDLDALAAVFAHPEVWRFPYGRAFTREETASFLDAQISEWAERGFGVWLAELRSTGEVLGYVGLSVPTFLPEILPAVEVGWRFAPGHWGQGYATEGAGAALDDGFDVLGLERICSLPQVDNPPSARVCDRLGMVRERQVTCPATDRRGSVEAWLYTTTAADRGRRT
jgi:RimJ/RimL family protein N-acetyltransferase